MASTKLFTVRPSRAGRTDLQDALRVYLSSKALSAQGLGPGDHILVASEAQDVRFCVIAWPAENISDSVVLISKSLLDTYQIKLGDKVSLQRRTSKPEPISRVTLCEVTEGLGSDVPLLQTSEARVAVGTLWQPLFDAQFIAPGLTFNKIKIADEKRSFRVVRVNSSLSAEEIYHFTRSSEVELSESEQGLTLGSHISLDTTKIGGLPRDIENIKEVVHLCNLNLEGEARKDYYSYNHTILFLDPYRCGHFHILEAFSNAGWREVLRIDVEKLQSNTTGGTKYLRETFQKAKKSQPSLIIVKDVEKVIASGETLRIGGCIADCLTDELEGLIGTDVFVVAMARNLSKLPDDLRHRRFFQFQIEIPIPDSKARAEILKLLLGREKEQPDEFLDGLAKRTHGFTEADLENLVRVARSNRVKYIEGVAKPSEADYAAALKIVGPSVIQDIVPKVPNVRWTDIGGQTEIKKALDLAIVMPFQTDAEILKRIGVQPARGMLLYGPPGCSKTMLAKAVATEADLNFLAVRGSELLNMYVGETERGIRDIFRKARAASPCVIFIDEIDSLASRRRGHTDVNTVTTLLIEMDGIDQQQRVFVLAATNIPDSLDPALLRPGRFDKLVFVDLPDIEARREILRLQAKEMNFSTVINLDQLAEATQGYSGAELVNVCREAATKCFADLMSSGSELIEQKHFDAALQQNTAKTTEAQIEHYRLWAEGALH